MHIEFDQRKAASNLQKHGVSFAEAESALTDPAALVLEDPDAGGEHRFLLVGVSAAGQTLTVIYTWRGEAIRLISARKATAREKRAYAQGI